MVLLGARIKSLRKETKLTQTELAELVGVTKSTIAAYENDSRQPSYEVLIKLANVFKVNIESLFFSDYRVSKISIDGLTREQIKILENLICSFREKNLADNVIQKNAPKLRDIINDCMNKGRYDI